MKRSLFTVALFLLPMPALSQAVLTRAEAMQQFCRAPEVKSGPEFDRITRIPAA